jgi:spermidine synthase
MKKFELIATSLAPDGGQFTLHRRDGEFFISVDGRELMSTRQHHSESILAEVVCGKFEGQDISVLIGGLGFGFTLQSALAHMTSGSKITVAELMDCIIAWNKQPDIGGCHQWLMDHRVSLVEADVFELLERAKADYDAIILDVDNGPEAFSTLGNSRLYGPRGLRAIRSALRPGGYVGIWSAHANADFEKQLSLCGFEVERLKVRARPNKGAVHSIFIGRA